MKSLPEIAKSTWAGFQRGEGTLRASALTYQSMLALIPFLTLISVTAGQFGYVKLLISALKRLDKRLALNLPFDTFDPIFKHIAGVQLSALGWMGSFSLLAIFIISMSHLEKAFNAMWGLNRHRNWLRRLRFYLPILVLFLSMVAVLAQILRQFLNAMKILVDQGIPLGEQIQVGSFLILLISLSFLVILFFFKNLPYAKVEWRPAFLASLATAIASSISLSLFTYFQTWLFNRYSVVYGSLAILPVLLLSFFVQWVFILLGCSLCCQLQNLHLPKKAHTGE